MPIDRIFYASRQGRVIWNTAKCNGRVVGRVLIESTYLYVVFHAIYSVTYWGVEGLVEYLDYVTIRLWSEESYDSSPKR